MRRILLSPIELGLFAKVSDVRYERVSRFRWRALKFTNHACYYAGRDVRVGSKRRLVLMHRDILGLVYKDGVKVDHRDGDGLNNTDRNLRANISSSQNIANSRRRKDNTSGYKGVTRHRPTGKWRARIGVDGRRVSLGLYPTSAAAHKAYVSAAKIHFGEFARVR